MAVVPHPPRDRNPPWAGSAGSGAGAAAAS